MAPNERGQDRQAERILWGYLTSLAVTIVLWLVAAGLIAGLVRTFGQG